jgi:CHAT domain-containing protein
MEDRVEFLMDSLARIKQGESNTGQIYWFWQKNIDKIDASLIQLMPIVARRLLFKMPQQQQVQTAEIFRGFGQSIHYFPQGNKRINVELAIAGYQICVNTFSQRASPVEWAATQNNLGAAYLERIQGNRQENIELAIAAFCSSLEVYTQQAFPLEWAMTQFNLGIVHVERVRGVREKNIEQAITAFHASLEVYTKQAFSSEWARSQTSLGSAYRKQIKGERRENIELAIAAYQASLEVYTCEAFPLEWARTQYSLANAYGEKIEGNHNENIELAIAAYRTLHKVYTRKAFPIEWARTQHALAIAYWKRSEGHRKRNIELAIAACQASLEVYTREEFPLEWARTKNCLCNVYIARIEGDRKQNIEQAIKICQALLEVYTREEFPLEWAMTQLNLANAYWESPTGEREQNIEKIIQAYQSSLEVYTREAFPLEWARAQSNLSNVYRERIIGERAKNIEQAIAACQASLEIRTQETFPIEWATTQLNLSSVYIARIEGDRKQNIEQAIQACQASLEVYTQETFPIEWATTQDNLGNAYDERIEGDREINLELAIQAYRASLKVSQPDLLPLDCLRTSQKLGDLGFKEGDWDVAIEGYDKAITAVEKSRSWAMNESRRQEILNESSNIYEKMVQSCVNANRLDIALQTIELVRSKRLVDLMAAYDLNLQGEVSEPVQDILDRIASTQQQMDNLRMSISDNTSALIEAGSRDRAATKPPTEEIQDLEVQKQTLLDELSRYDAVSAQLVEISPPNITQIQTELLDRTDTAILSFYTTTEDTHILVVRSNSIQCFTCQGQGIEQLQKWLYDEWILPYIEDRANWPRNMPERLQQLAEKLELDRLISEHLQDTRELILIPHLLLHLIPFAALPLKENQQYLGDRFLLRYAPGCQVLKFCTDRDELPSQQQYGTVENATDDLPFAAIEGEAIAQIFQIDDTFRLRGSQQATIDAYKQLLNQVNSVVSSHHAQSRLDNPLESALLLANGRRVTLADLLSPAWRFADLGDVFLSCCETGMAMPESVTDELLTLGTGFLCAGARSVISSLWAVNDLSAAIFSQIYHQYRAQGHDRIVSLQKAQQDLRCMSGEQLRALSEAEFIPALIAQQEELDQCRRNAKIQNNQSEAKRYGQLIDRLVKTQIKLEEYWERSLPFEHPVDWAAFTCQGLR